MLQKSAIVFTSALLAACGASESGAPEQSPKPITKPPVDTSAPLLTLTGSETIQLAQGQYYTELGAQAVDETDGNISSKIIIDDSQVNADKIGQYSVNYSVSDDAGNLATLERTVQVLLDSDGDGLADINDSDDDNDGYLDTNDYAPLDPTIWFDNTSKDVQWLNELLANAEPGTTIDIPAGHYHGAISLASNQPLGNAEAAITLMGATDSDGNSLVTFDGTVDVNDLANTPWQLVNGIWQRQLKNDTSLWQLFLQQPDNFANTDYSQMVPARWPNAKFTDGSIYSRSAWAKATDTSHNPVMKHKSLIDDSYSGSKDQLVSECFSPFADGENPWTMDNIGNEQRTWLQQQTYTVNSESKLKCVGITTDAQVSYQPAGQAQITHSLAAQSFDATGAMAILNYGHWRTWTRPVLSHTPGSDQFSHIYAPEYHGKNHYYYLEGALSLLDSEQEWYFDKNTQVLYFKTPNNDNPNDLIIRAKVQSYAFEMSKAQHVIFKDINFFATTLRCNNCSNITIDNANFEFGGASKRMLNQWANVQYRKGQLKLIDSEPDNVYVSGSNGYETQSADKYQPVLNTFKNSRVTNTDSPALHFNGKGSLISNNHFENVDYSCSEGWSHQAAVNTYMGFDTNFSYNTLINTACSQALRGRAGSDITHNYIKNAGWAQTDGALLGGGHAMAAAYNWTMDHKEKGMRFDAAWPPTRIDQWGIDSYAHHNVSLRSKGMVFKGWKQRIYNNTIVDLDYINPITRQVENPVIPRLVIHNDTKKTKDSNDPNSTIALCVGQPLSLGGCGAGVGTLYANNLSAIMVGNIGPNIQRGESLTTVGGPILATASNNFETNASATSNDIVASQQNKVQSLLRDVNNYDFRPRRSASELIGQGADIANTEFFSKTTSYADYAGLPSAVNYIGAYHANANYYPIPGQRQRRASHPIPLDNSLAKNAHLSAKVDSDLIWRSARLAQDQQIKYWVYFDNQFVGSYDQQQNIHYLTEHTLVPGQQYQWRVDVELDGVLRVGDSWHFRVE